PAESAEAVGTLPLRPRDRPRDDPAGAGPRVRNGRRPARRRGAAIWRGCGPPGMPATAIRWRRLWRRAVPHAGAAAVPGGRAAGGAGVRAGGPHPGAERDGECVGLAARVMFRRVAGPWLAVSRPQTAGGGKTIKSGHLTVQG